MVCMWSIPLLLVALCASSQSSQPIKWQIKGSLSEACTCNVPCSCNFGEGPSPHEYCYTVFSFWIKQGEYNGIRLDGLKVAAANGQGGKVLYLDERASTAQRPALERLGRIVCQQGLGRDDLGEKGRKQWRAIVFARITQEVNGRANKLEIGDAGGFKADYIFGRDPTKPVVVENNTIWAIERAIKAKTVYLKYRDKYGNDLDHKATNSNQGDFVYDQRTRL